MLFVMKAKDYATLVGTLCGISAIVCALPPISAYRFAMMLIFLGVAADLLDGFIARKTGGGNAFGVELDSLSDSIVFGVAPSLIAYLTYSGNNYQTQTEMGLTGHHPIIMLIPAFILIAGGIIRLAYFNISEESNYYIGMPIPITASALCAFMLVDYFAFLSFNQETTIINQIMHWGIPMLMIFLAYCNTTSKLKYGHTFRKKTGFLKYLFLIFAITFVILAIFIIFFRYKMALIIFIVLLLYLGLFVWFVVKGFTLDSKSKENKEEN